MALSKAELRLAQRQAAVEGASPGGDALASARAYLHTQFDVPADVREQNLSLEMLICHVATLADDALAAATECAEKAEDMVREEKRQHEKTKRDLSDAFAMKRAALADLAASEQRRTDVEGAFQWFSVEVARAAGFDGVVTGEQIIERITATRTRVGELADKLEYASAIPVRVQWPNGSWRTAMLSEISTAEALQHVVRWLRGIVEPEKKTDDASG